MNTAPDIPTLQDELDRKVLETIESMHLRFKRGEITAAQLLTASEAIWGCASGLVSFDKEFQACVIELELLAKGSNA